MYGNPVPTHTGTGSCVHFSSFCQFFKGEPGSYPYRNRFPRVKKPFSALLTAFFHFNSNPHIPIRILTWETLKHIQFASFSHQTTCFHHFFSSTDTLVVFHTYSDTIRHNLTQLG